MCTGTYRYMCRHVENTHAGTHTSSRKSVHAGQVRMELGKSKVPLQKVEASSFLDFYYIYKNRNTGKMTEW